MGETGLEGVSGNAVGEGEQVGLSSSSMPRNMPHESDRTPTSLRLRRRIGKLDWLGLGSANVACVHGTATTVESEALSGLESGGISPIEVTEDCGDSTLSLRLEEDDHEDPGVAVSGAASEHGMSAVRGNNRQCGVITPGGETLKSSNDDERLRGTLDEK